MPNHIFKISIDTGSNTVSGLVKLSDDVNNNSNVSGGIASTPYATKQAYDKAVEIDNRVTQLNTTVTNLESNKFDTSGGTISGDVVVDGDITVTGIINASISGTSENAVNAEYANKDKDGNIITETYVPKTDIFDNNIIKSSILPSYVDDVIEADNYDVLPTTGESSKIYVTIDDNKTYRWSGSTYVEISASLALGTVSGTAYEGSAGKLLEDQISTIQNDITTIEGDIVNINETLQALQEDGTTVVQVNITNGELPTNSYDIILIRNSEDMIYSFERPKSSYRKFYIYFYGSGKYNVTLPDSIRWDHGIPPKLSENGVDIIKFVTVDVGNNWFGIPVTMES